MSYKDLDQKINNQTMTGYLSLLLGIQVTRYCTLSPITAIIPNPGAHTA